MKKQQILLGIVLGGFVSGLLYAGNAIEDLNMGLSKASVFDTPTPEVAEYSKSEAGKNERLPIAYSTLPPQIGHTVEEYLPITREENECADCHDRRKLLKREWRVGKKLPMPDNHYGSFNKQGGVEEIAGARYNCTQCHVPLSNAQPLVENTFK
ncbi:MAG: nitrate reductase cytochrome c-type subunit [Gammaproteobacteria bacterium]|nr:nitrate reductase cytochrome c-type subunit [Gammaproteobacteria bacterium]